MAEIKWIKKYEKKVRVIPSPPKPQTNADRIRQMTDEELADYLRWHNDLYSRNGMDWLDWLRKEADE